MRAGLREYEHSRVYVCVCAPSLCVRLPAPSSIELQSVRTESTMRSTAFLPTNIKGPDIAQYGVPACSLSVS